MDAEKNKSYREVCQTSSLPYHSYNLGKSRCYRLSYQFDPPFLLGRGARSLAGLRKKLGSVKSFPKREGVRQLYKFACVRAYRPHTATRSRWILTSKMNTMFVLLATAILFERNNVTKQSDVYYF